MRAVVLEQFGGPEALHLTEAPKPEPGWAEVLVRVHAAGTNQADVKQRGGQGPLSLPMILGYDVAGVVAEIGRGVTIFAPGDEVYGMPRFPEQGGGYAEFVPGPSRHFAPKPAALSFDEAASLPLSGLIAWQALVETADVQPGQRVLMHGAAGAVGTLAIQIAKTRGAYVIGTARASRHAALRALGVDELIDYTAVRFEDAVADVDIALDLVGGDYAGRSVPVMNRGGIVIAVTGPVDSAVQEQGRRAGVRVTDIMVEPDHAGLQHLGDLVDHGSLTTDVGAVVPIDEAARAHRMLQSREVAGKVILSIPD